MATQLEMKIIRVEKHFAIPSRIDEINYTTKRAKLDILFNYKRRSCFKNLNFSSGAIQRCRALESRI